MKAKTIVIKWNNCASNDPCAICGCRTDPIVGPEFFVEGDWQLLCNQCAKTLSPELFAVWSRMLDSLDLTGPVTSNIWPFDRSPGKEGCANGVEGERKLKSAPFDQPGIPLGNGEYPVPKTNPLLPR